LLQWGEQRAQEAFVVKGGNDLVPPHLKGRCLL
jgi:hypothetical protein